MNLPADRLDFKVVEHYVAHHHPDPDIVRNDAANHHGIDVAAPHIALLLNVTRSNVLRWRTSGVPYYDADLIAIRLGRHPSEIWDDWWLLEPSQEDRDVRNYWRTLRARALEESLALREAARQS